MNIAILTQPLLFNYGGILQNWALQQVLLRMGHNPVTVDYLYKTPSDEYIWSCIRSLAVQVVKGKLLPGPQRVEMKRNPEMERFVQEHIRKTAVCRQYGAAFLDKYKIDALVVGSDQVWRPMYNYYTLSDMYLGFAERFVGPKVAYAASFGTDRWEYSSGQTEKAQKWIRQFSAVSVREHSAVELCKTYFGIDAVDVLDPTLLLEREDYLSLCAKVPQREEAFLLAYVLDENPDGKTKIEALAEEKGLPVKHITPGKTGTLDIPEWLSFFRDSRYVVTDSFHGTVFSILFGKEYLCLGNEGRGMSRFESLFEKARDIELWREKSLQFLQNALCRP